MDRYTDETKQWLDQRFRMTDEKGIYVAHQPIYGFEKGHTEPGVIVRYMITYQIMKALSHLNFSSLLDVGGAEGYKAALTRSLFNIRVRSADLSTEACARAKEIFDVDGEPIDICQLPYNDNEFDVLLCSETLEHVPDIEKATYELLRVCRKAVVITVPHESRETVEKHISEGAPHTHLHSLDTSSFDFLLPKVVRLISKRFHNPILVKICYLLDTSRRSKSRSDSRLLDIFKNWSISLIRLLSNGLSARMLIRLDDLISDSVFPYIGLCFIILKDGDCYATKPQVSVSAGKILNFRVPYHYILQNQPGT